MLAYLFLAGQSIVTEKNGSWNNLEYRHWAAARVYILAAFGVALLRLDRLYL